MKKGPEKFTQHEKSDCHRNASEKLQNVKRIGIDALLSKQVQEEQERAIEEGASHYVFNHPFSGPTRFVISRA